MDDSGANLHLSNNDMMKWGHAALMLIFLIHVLSALRKLAAL